jgi:aryl-alcohol dehydrogenase-like predicted oxidoreductase
MKMNPLGRTDIMVSALCLGSMTWGTQNTEAEGHAQIDLALDHGINFIDTAEMYPVNPLSKETQGDTERVIGSWIKSSGRREDIVLATKVSGEGLKYVRDGAPISPATIKQALDQSLTSLQTDYVDLYQLHWPNRGSYMFRQNWRYDPTSQNTTETEDHMLETLTYLNDMISEGKIRSIGLSNESCWGTMRWLQMAEKHHLPRMASIQNEYSLLCRLYDLDMAEMTHHEQVGLLSFSPLATGLLTGKYSENSQPPAGSRASITSDLGGRTTQRVWPAVAAYQDIADRFGLDLTAMSLAWCMQRSFMTSTIFGATSLDQMKQSLKAADLILDQQVLTAIDSAHKAHPMPY